MDLIKHYTDGIVNVQRAESIHLQRNYFLVYNVKHKWVKGIFLTHLSNNKLFKEFSKFRQHFNKVRRYPKLRKLHFAYIYVKINWLDITLSYNLPLPWWIIYSGNITRTLSSHFLTNQLFMTHCCLCGLPLIAVFHSPSCRFWYFCNCLNI